MRGRNILSLGPIENYNLRHLMIDVTGGPKLTYLRPCLRCFKNLERLDIFDEGIRLAIRFQKEILRWHLMREEEKDEKKPKKTIPNYRAPQVNVRGTPPLTALWGIEKT